MANNSKSTARVRKKHVGQKMKPRRLSPRSPAPARPRRNKQKAPNQTSPGLERGTRPEVGVPTFTFHVNSTLTLVCVPTRMPSAFPLEVAANLTGVHPDMLRYYCRIGLFGADRAEMTSEPSFDEEALQEVRRIEHYRRHLAVSRRALPLVCELRRQAERQRIEIHFLKCPSS